MERYIGVDLHKNSFTVCYLSETGEKELKVFKVNSNGLEKFKGTLNKEDVVAVEVAGNAGYFVRMINEAVKEVEGNNPLHLRLYPVQWRKRDLATNLVDTEIRLL